MTALRSSPIHKECFLAQNETSTPTAYPIYTAAAKADSAAIVVDLGEQKVSVSVTVR